MIVKLALVTVILAIIIIYLKSVNPELAMLAAICAGAILIMAALDMLNEVFALYERIASVSGISDTSLKIVIKVTVISYIVEFSAGIVEEFGMKSLADKLVFIGKIIIILLAVPVLEAMINVIEGLL